MVQIEVLTFFDVMRYACSAQHTVPFDVVVLKAMIRRDQDKLKSFDIFCVGYKAHDAVSVFRP